MEKKKKKKKTRRAKVTDSGLEGFVDWTNPRVSELAEEEEAKMSSLVYDFSMTMHKRAANAQGETAPISEVLGRNHPKLSGPSEEA